MDSGSCSGESVFCIQHILLFSVKSFSPDVLAYALAVFVLLIASAVVSAAEAAYFSLQPADIESLKEEDSRVAKDILYLRNNHRYLLSTILIVNNLINICIILITYLIFDKLFEFSDYNGFIHVPGSVIEFLITVAVTTYFLVLLAEITPKVYASQHNVRISRITATSIRFLLRLLYPFSFLLVKSSDFIERKLKRDYREINLEEIADAIELAADEETTDKEVDMLKGIVHLGNKQARQVMQPRTKISAIDISVNFEQLIQEARSCGYSRIPVYEEELDNVKGVIHVKDLLAHLTEEKNYDWRKLIRKAEFVPETKKIDDLLKEIQKSGKHLVIVVDEYGGTSGLLTLEDIVEEVLGDIRDEFDEQQEAIYKKQTDGSYLFDAAVMLNDFCKIMELPPDSFDEYKGEAESLGGLLIEICGKLPAENQVIEQGGFSFTVVKSENNLLKRIKVVQISA